jgi:glycerol uptake facilitator-like aquaporin
MFDLPILQLSTHLRTGSGQWFSEGVATFGLLLTIFGCGASAPSAVPFAVGLYITAPIGSRHQRHLRIQR